MSTGGGYGLRRGRNRQGPNERVTTIIDSGYLRVAVVQIASRFFRRIVTFVREGDRLDIGQRTGAIILGSQVDIVIPDLPGISIVVQPGHRTKAGVTVIARLPGFYRFLTES